MGFLDKWAPSYDSLEPLGLRCCVVLFVWCCEVQWGKVGIVNGIKKCSSTSLVKRTSLCEEGKNLVWLVVFPSHICRKKFPYGAKVIRFSVSVFVSVCQCVSTTKSNNF